MKRASLAAGLLLLAACQDSATNPSAVGALGETGTPLLQQNGEILSSVPSGEPASFSGGATGPSSSISAIRGPSFSLSASAGSPKIVRIYKDHDAWSYGGGRDEATLVYMGLVKNTTYFVHPMSALASGIPSGTAVVVMTSNSNGVSSTSASQRSAGAQAALSAFLATGGTVLVDMGDNDSAGGYNAPGATGTPSYVFPSNCSDASIAPAGRGPDGLLGTSDDHPVVKGRDGIAGTSDDINDSRIDLGSSCSVVHGNLEEGITLPSDARVLATSAFSGGPKAIMAEYCHNGGRVVLNTLTLGFGGQQPVGNGWSYTQASLFSYALSDASSCGPVDDTGPTITPVVTGTTGSAAWYVGDVQVSWTVEDGESPITAKSGCDASSVLTDTESQSFTCTATSAGGSSSATVVVKRDATAPSITGTASTGAWTNGNVTVSFVCSDVTSGVAFCEPSRVVSTEGADQSAYGSVQDNAGNGATTTVSGINIDKTKPTITGTASTTSWTNSSVTVSFVCTDALSGVASCEPLRTVSTEGAGQSVMGSVADRAGNEASTSVGGIDIDLTKPVVAFSGNAGSYTVDQSVAIACSATDALSGIDTSTCPTASGAAFSFALGANALSASATDNAGNTATASTSFTVTVGSESLCALTRRFVSQQGIANSMCQKLDAAARANANARSGLIGAYVNEVQAQSGKSVTATNATTLIRLARAL